MPRGSTQRKPAIAIDPDIHGKVIDAAASEGISTSAWMTNAARLALLRQAGLAAVAEWQEEHGAFTEEELKASRRRVRAQLRGTAPARRSA